MDAKQKTEGLANRGNWAALKKTMKRAEEGKSRLKKYIQSSMRKQKMVEIWQKCQNF